MEATHNGRKIETKVVSGRLDAWLMEILVWPVTINEADIPKSIYRGLTGKLEEDAHASAMEYAKEWIDSHLESSLRETRRNEC